MRRLFSIMAVVVAFVIVVSSPAVLAGQQQPPAQTKVFEGALASVDANAKTLSVKGAGGTEMIFMYTDQTVVDGPDKTVQGLAGKTGTELKITYRDQAGKNLATKIEMVEKK
jgi:hypothetical protein